MALLQIAEPGEATAPHQHRLAVGIDLGTTNSLVATVRSGTAVVLPNHDGDPLLPSVVRYEQDGQVVVGHAAKAAQADDPENTIVSVKRFMGRGIADVAKYGALPYKFIDAPGMVKIDTSTGDLTSIRPASIAVCTLPRLVSLSLTANEVLRKPRFGKRR